MKKLLTLTGIWSAFLFLLPGCTKVDSGDLKDDVPYHQGYSVIYNKTMGVTHVSAWFRVRNNAGARLRLANGSGVTANGLPGNTANPFDPTIYTWQFDGLKDIATVLTKNGRTLSNAVRLSDIGDLRFPATLAAEINRNADYSFNWEGTQLNPGEHLYIGVSGRSLNDSTLNTGKEKELTGFAANITSADLREIRPGTLTITLRREKNKSLDEYDGSGTGGTSLTRCIYKDIVLKN